MMFSARMRLSAASTRTRAFAPTSIFAASRSTMRRASSKLRMISGTAPKSYSSAPYKKRAAEAARLFNSKNALLLLAGLVLGFDGAAEKLDVSLGCVSVFSGGLEFQIFIEGLDSPGGGNRFTALVVGHLVHQVHTFLVIGFSEIRLDLDGLVKELDRTIKLRLFLRLVNVERTLVGEHSAGVEIKLGGARRVDLGGGVVFLHGGSGVSGADQRLAEIVVVSTDVLGLRIQLNGFAI